MYSKLTIVLLFLVFLRPALQPAEAGERRSCSDIRTSYNLATDLFADAFTLRPEDARWPLFLEWAKAKRIYTSTIVGLSEGEPKGIVFRWAQDTVWQKDAVVPFGQALAHIIAEREWRDTDFPEFFDSRGGVYDINLAERLAEIESQTLTPWHEFFQAVTAPKSPALSSLNSRLLSIAPDGQSASVLLGKDRTVTYAATRLQNDFASFLSDCSLAKFFQDYDEKNDADPSNLEESDSASPVPERGKEIYTSQCSGCHGINGDGRGTLALNWLPRPRDFTYGSFRYRSTPTGGLPTDEDLFQTVNKGLPGGGMPAFEAILSEQDRRDTVAYIKQFSPRFTKGSTAKPTVVPDLPEVTPERIARGVSLYADSGCASCHGAEGRGDGRSGQDLKTSEGDPIAPRDLTHKWSFRGGHTPQDIYKRIANGMDGSSMAAYGEEVLERDQIWDIVFYILSLSSDQRPRAEASH